MNFLPITLRFAKVLWAIPFSLVYATPAPRHSVWTFLLLADFFSFPLSSCTVIQGYVYFQHVRDFRGRGGHCFTHHLKMHSSFKLMLAFCVTLRSTNTSGPSQRAQNSVMITATITIFSTYHVPNTWLKLSLIPMPTCKVDIIILTLRMRKLRPSKFQQLVPVHPFDKRQGQDVNSDSSDPKLPLATKAL